MDEVDQLKITLKGYRERLMDKVITLEVGSYGFGWLMSEINVAKDGESFLAIAFGLASVSKYGFSKKAFWAGENIFNDVKAITGAFTAPKLKSAFEEGLIDRRPLIKDVEKKIAREALEIMLGEKAIASC